MAYFSLVGSNLEYASAVRDPSYRVILTSFKEYREGQPDLVKVEEDGARLTPVPILQYLSSAGTH